MCTQPNMAIFTSFISCFLGMNFRYFLNDFEVVQVARVSTATTFVLTYHIRCIGPGSVVGIATACGLDGPGIESRWGEIFRTCPDRL
jgi:hypothetical protein